MRLAIIILVILHTTALAEPNAFVSKSRGAELFDEARALASAGKIDEACDRFAESWRVEPAVGTALNLADCKERKGELLAALHMFGEAARIARSKSDPHREAFAKNRAAAIEPRLAHVEIRLAAPIARGITVTLNGRDMPIVPVIHARMDPVALEIRVTTPAGKTYTQHVDARSGRIVIDVPALVQTRTQRTGRRLWIVGGLLVAGAIGAVQSQRLAMSADDHRDSILPYCPLDPKSDTYVCEGESATRAERTLHDASRLDLASNVLLATSIVAVGTAAVLWYTAPKERVVVTPTITPSAAGVAVSGSF